ncbi:MAG: hypothetical protein JW837_08280 [Sedimentisphaerales bacterium]|nr:hypothetical protein [Sedimentisphaerales bacterium]
MRKLSTTFMNSLKYSFLAGIIQKVIADSDLTLEIRDNYINLYFKGNSLLKLSESINESYKAYVHEKFRRDLDIPLDFVDHETTAKFLKNIPLLKENIVMHGKHSLEIEYEQMIIRANNFEPRNNSEYFIIDRQYVVGKQRFDLVGIFWDRVARRKGQEVDLCFIEVKFALNQDISEVHNQLKRYYETIEPNAGNIAEESEAIFRQKLELGLYKQSTERVEAMKTLSFSKDISKFQFILVLVDYNPNSSRLNLKSLAVLPFAEQIRVFYGGFAMWQQHLISHESF